MLPRALHSRLLAACVVLAAPAAFAQSDAGKIAAARQLGFDGIKDFEAGNFAEASDKLERAYALVQAPTIGLWSARALVKLNRLILASERYLETTRLPLPETNRENHERAKADAATEREALLPRIPRLRVDVKGAPPTEVQLAMDDVAIQSALIGVARPVDPGKHRVVAKWQGAERSQEVELAEGASKSVTLDFTGVAPSAPSSPTTPGTPPAASTPPPSTPAPRDTTTKGSNTLAWIAIGVGGVGLATGTVTGLMAMSKHGDLEDSGQCNDGKCGPAVHDDVDTLNLFRTVSTVGFVVGAVGVGTGVTLLLTGSDAPKATGQTRLQLSPGYVSVTRSF